MVAGPEDSQTCAYASSTYTYILQSCFAAACASGASLNRRPYMRSTSYGMYHTYRTVHNATFLSWYLFRCSLLLLLMLYFATSSPSLDERLTSSWSWSWSRWSVYLSVRISCTSCHAMHRLRKPSSARTYYGALPPVNLELIQPANQPAKTPPSLSQSIGNLSTVHLTGTRF